jgi:hypothetical protein
MKNKHHRHSILVGILLLLLSVLFYCIHYAFFHDSHHLFMFLVGDIAFVFIEVLMVTLIIHQVLSNREKRSTLKKLNMVIGAFFSEVGISLLSNLKGFDCERESLSKHLLIDDSWTPKKFKETQNAIRTMEYKIDSQNGDLESLKAFLLDRRGFLLGLLENPNLLEHEDFTELLWAVFHLTEELSYRKSVHGLTENDYKHLSGDAKRAYTLLVLEWLSYMQHLKESYPYLFSLAVRTNPFNPDASVEVA